MTHDEILSLIKQASLAPSVHNVQPARWRIEDESLVLFDDLSTHLDAADPQGSDAAMSLGASVEGLALAASQNGMSVVEENSSLPQAGTTLRPIARYGFAAAVGTDPLADYVSKRQSWRGTFETPSQKDRQNARSLVTDDTSVLCDADDVHALAPLVDAASFGFMRNGAFRSELLSWMRLSHRHERWALDGLNASAMHLNAAEAFAAGIIMGPAFGLLDRLSLAPKLLAETKKTTSAAGLVVFHRPVTETAFESGRHFYRLWLRIEAAGFAAAVLAALADDGDAAKLLAERAGIGPDRRIVSAFRIGRRPAGAQTAIRARRPLGEILV